MAQHAILRFEKHMGNPTRPLEAHHERQKDFEKTEIVSTSF